MAAESPQVRERAEVSFYALPVRSVLNRESSGRLPFAWTINPYRGCEFGCKYCYARYTHEFMELRDGLDFERKIYAKTGAPEILRAELRRACDRGLPIALGTATDPYQPAEKRFRITRRLLEVFAEFEGLQFSITTKSVVILNDLELLKKLAAMHDLSVHVTVTTTDAHLARRIEPKAPPPQRRLAAVARLAGEGIFVGVNAMPVLPGLTDSPAGLEDLARQAAQAGAKFLYANPLFLQPSAMRQFMPFLRREFPHLVRRYAALYARSAYLSQEYKDQLAEILTSLRARYGLNAPRPERSTITRPTQLALCYT